MKIKRILSLFVAMVICLSTFTTFAEEIIIESSTYDEYVDYNTFDYLVFWYNAEPNSFIGANSPQLQIFGVK